jgi:hypothetical protein
LELAHEEAGVGPNVPEIHDERYVQQHGNDDDETDRRKGRRRGDDDVEALAPKS